MEKEHNERERKLLEVLKNLNLSFERIEHPAVFTVEESKKLLPNIPGQGTKNLLLEEEKTGQLYFFVIAEEKQLDLKKLRILLGKRRFSFAKPEKIKKYLGTEPGSLTALGLIFDPEHVLNLIIDQQVINAEFVACHPLINTATLLLTQDNFQRFLKHTGHSYSVLPFED